MGLTIKDIIIVSFLVRIRRGAGCNSIARLLKPGQALVTRRPFRTPHHTAMDWHTPGECHLSKTMTTSQSPRQPVKGDDNGSGNLRSQVVYSKAFTLQLGLRQKPLVFGANSEGS